MEKINSNKNKSNYQNTYGRNKTYIKLKMKNRKSSNKKTEDSNIIKNNTNDNYKTIYDSICNNIINKTKQFKINELNKSTKSYSQSVSTNQKRINSTIQYSHQNHKNLIPLKLFDNKEIYLNDTFKDNKKEDTASTILIQKHQKPIDYSAYYYSGRFPLKNKYIIENIPKEKTLTSYSFKKNNNNINNTFKKIDNLAKSLSLFQNNKCLFEDINKNCSREHFLKIYKKDSLNSKK